MKQAAFDDIEDFTDPDLWSIETKTPITLEHACCANCGKRPETINPLPAGWFWDTMELNNRWLSCPSPRECPELLRMFPS